MPFFRSPFGRAALATAFVLSTAAAAHAEQFNFSYQFADASVITGTLSGQLDGQFVDNVSDVHLWLNGSAFSGSLFAAAWNTTTANWDNTTPARVSTDASLNNFIFADANVPTDFNVSNYFYMVNDPASLGHEAFATNLNNGGIALDNPIDNGKWTLTEVAAVPEPATYAMFLAGASLLAAAVRRSRRG
jgi:hypothetical protein